MYTPKSITEIRDGSTKSKVASGFPITQGLEWKQMHLSKENQGTVLRERGRGTGKKRQHMLETSTIQVTNSEHRSRINPNLPSYKLLLHSHNIQHCRRSISWFLIHMLGLLDQSISNLQTSLEQMVYVNPSRTRLDACRSMGIEECVCPSIFSTSTNISRILKIQLGI